MTPVQILRTLATALILGGLSLGLIPMGSGGSCGSGWLEGAGVGIGCGPVMAPVGSWALALIVVGATMHVSAWMNTPYRPKDNKASKGQQVK